MDKIAVYMLAGAAIAAAGGVFMHGAAALVRAVKPVSPVSWQQTEDKIATALDRGGDAASNVASKLSPVPSPVDTKGAP